MIKRLILKNNNGLLTKGTKKVDLTFKDLVNIFMGRNGFGKTSILKECHPFPPDNSDYHTGGYKYAEWETVNKDLIIVESFTGPNSTHSFLLNGEEKNQGGTLTVQKDLCLKHLGLTPQLIKMMTGIKPNDLLSNMSPMLRKQVFMQMYPNDTTYALKVYNKIKDELRNVTGALKNQYRRLSEEQTRAEWLKEQSPDYLSTEIEKLEQLIKDGMVLSGVLDNTYEKSEEIQTAKNQLNRLVSSLVNESLDIVLTPEQLKDEIHNNERRIDAINLKIHWTKTKLQETMDLLSGHNCVEDNPELLDQQLTRLMSLQHSQVEESQLLIDSTNRYFVDVNDQGLETIANAGNELNEHLTLLTLASSTDMTLTKYNALLSQFDEVTQRGRSLKATVEDLTHTLNHYDTQDSTTCPECDHEFKVGFDVKSIELKRKQLTIANNDLSKVTALYRTLKEQLNNDKDYYDSMSKLVNLAKRLDDNHHTLITLLKSKRVGYDDSSELINHINQLITRFKLQRKVNDHYNQINDLKLRIERLKRNDLRQLTLLIEELEYVLAEQLRIRNRYLEQNQVYRDKLGKIESRELKLQQLEYVQEQLLHLYKDQGRYLIKEANNQALAEWVPTKDRYVQMLIRGKSLLSVIDSIKLDIEHLEQRKVKLELLLTSLCPNKGLLGELMSSFIMTVVGNMNAIIREVFTTPLYIKPCINKKGDLTYKFPIVNSTTQPPAKDLEDCSGGEQDMLNFAFRQVLIRYKSPGYPLVLDEVGIKLDNYHQNKFFEYVARLSTFEQVRQILMVSHFMSHVGMFKGANVVALNSEGIDVPDQANANATFN